MDKGRLEAFSDGVFAIILTIMVLELRVPHGAEPADLLPLIPIFLSYVLSFIYIGIYWSNHHHLFQATKQVQGGTLWANLHLLFWLSLMPFVTAWAGENHFSSWPVLAYGFGLFMAAVAYSILVRTLIRHHGRDSLLARAMGSDLKGNLSMGLYAIALPIALWQPLISCLLYVIVAVVWLVPDQRIEKVIDTRPST